MRQFILDTNPDKNGLVVLCGKDFKYLRQVLRIKVGDMVTASLPNGSIQNFTVAACDQKIKKITLQICASSDFEQKNITRGVSANEVFEEKNNVEYWLFQFIPRMQKLEQIVKQATECGVKKIVLISSEYAEESSLMSLAGAKQERLVKIIKEARQQSGSPVQTEFTQPMKLDEAVELWNKHIADSGAEHCCSVVLSERNDDTTYIDCAVENKSNITQVCVAVGNEGGVSPAELELLKNNQFVPVHFAGNILRCETAALYGIACIQAFVEKNNREKVNTQLDSDKSFENSDDNEKDISEEYGEEAWL